MKVCWLSHESMLSDRETPAKYAKTTHLIYFNDKKMLRHLTAFLYDHCYT